MYRYITGMQWITWCSSRRDGVFIHQIRSNASLVSSLRMCLFIDRDRLPLFVTKLHIVQRFEPASESIMDVLADGRTEDQFL